MQVCRELIRGVPNAVPKPGREWYRLNQFAGTAITKSNAPRRVSNRPARRGVIGCARSKRATEKFRQRPTLPHGNRAVPSALEGLTAVFGMGTGGTPPM